MTEKNGADQKKLALLKKRHKARRTLASTLPDIAKLRRRLKLRQRTWAQIKSAVEAAGVKDDDPVFGIDLGPDHGRIVVERDTEVPAKNGSAGINAADVKQLGVTITDDYYELLDDDLQKMQGRR